MSKFVADLIAGWNEATSDIRIERSAQPSSPSIHPPIDMLALLIARYPDLPERIARMREGLPNPPIVIKSECPRCGTTIEQPMAFGSKRVYCSERCARKGR